MSTQSEAQSFNRESFQERLPQHYRVILSEFRKISRTFVYFNVLFVLLSLAELTLFLFFLPLLSQSSILAIALAALFVTFFSYPILLFYYQAKKPEQLSALLNRFVTSCKASLGLPSGIALHHLSIADTLLKLSQYLTDYESLLIKPLRFLGPIAPVTERISAYCYWHDVFRFKQLLLHAAIQEHLHQIRLTPTDLEVHASLGNAYVALSQIYKQPFYTKYAASFEEKFKMTANLAIEEFQILSQYAPNDPWVHEQLAAGYRELGLHTEHIQEMELLWKLKPQDREILFSLGSLYFQQGLNAKGLQVYEELKKARFKKVEDLLSNYGRTATSEHHLMPLNI
jgi:tetratricopeptide (TPR) repeat protein